MSKRSSRRNKRLHGRSLGTVSVTSDTSEDVCKATETGASNKSKVQTRGTKHTVEADRESERSSLSAQSNDNSLQVVDETTSKKNTTRERTNAGDRLTKRRQTEYSAADKDDEPAKKQSKQMKDKQPDIAFQHTTAAKTLEEKEILESEGESEMETDDNEETEQGNREQIIHRARLASESDLTATSTMEGLVRSKSQHHQQKQISSGMHSSVESNNVPLSSNAVSHSSSNSSVEPRRRAVLPQLHNETIQQQQQKLVLSSYRPRYTNNTSVADTLKTLKTREQDREHCCRKLCSLLKYFLMISVFVVSAVLITLLATTEEEHHTWLTAELQSAKSGEMDNMPVSIDTSFDRLRKKFTSQTGRLWGILEAATFPLIEEDNPAHPAVVLLVAGKRSSPVAECLAGRYAMLVSESIKAPSSHATFDCARYTDDNDDDTKRQLDSVLSTAFDAGSKSGVVLHLEKLRGSAPMIFYRFADNDNAPYKDVTIVLTLSLESTEITGSERDNVAYDELRQVWGSGLDVDKLEPLLSRIGNSVAFVLPETEEVMASLNC